MYTSAKNYIVAHKVISSLLAIVLIGGGYYGYKKYTDTSGETRYMLTTVQRGTIIASVSGSGQVSSENRVDIKPKASGDLIRMLVKDGDKVKAGQAIAYIDSTDAQKAVRDAQTSLETAQLSLQKIQQPADKLTLTQQQNSAENAKSTLATAYTAAFNNISDAFLDLPTVMTGLNSILFSYNSALGGSSQQNMEYYKNAIDQYDSLLRGAQYKDDAHAKYLTGKASYDEVFARYKTTSRTADTATIEKLLEDTYKMTQLISDSVKSTNNLVQLYQDLMTKQNLTPATVSTTQITNLSSYTSTINSHLSSLSSSGNSISTSKQNIDVTAQTLQKTVDGADPLDLRSSELAVAQKENALQDAKNTLADYTVRAPFDGVIGNTTAHKGDSVSSGSAIAAIVGNQQIAQLSLNEVDAAKIKSGQKATLTFDAIEDLSVAGTVADVNPIGAVSQGVVSYTIKIAFDANDPRVKPGMTVNATIQTDVRQNVLMVPSGAVKTTNNQSVVQIFTPPLVDTDGTGVTSSIAPSPKPVQTGISDDTNVEIISGLTEGQQVVARSVTGTAATATTNTATTRTTGQRPGGGNALFIGR